MSTYRSSCADVFSCPRMPMMFQLVPSYCNCTTVRAFTTPACSVLPMILMGLAPVLFTFSVAPATAIADVNRTLTMPFFRRMKSLMATVFACVVAAVLHVPMPLPAFAMSRTNCCAGNFPAGVPSGLKIMTVWVAPGAAFGNPACTAFNTFAVEIVSMIILTFFVVKNLCSTLRIQSPPSYPST